MNSGQPATIVVVGCGCIGSFIGGRIALEISRESPTLEPAVRFLVNSTGRGDAFKQAALRNGGVTLCSGFGRKFVGFSKNLVITSDPAEALAGAAVILCATKRGANKNVSELLAAHAPPNATVLLFQNGLDAPSDFHVLSGFSIFQVVTTFNVVRAQDKAAMFVLTSPTPKLTLGKDAETAAEAAAPGIVRFYSCLREPYHYIYRLTSKYRVF